MPINLTEREVLIIQLVCDEKGSRQIAEAVGVGPRQVDKLRRAIIQKVGSKTVAGLLKYAVLNGICFPFLKQPESNE